MQIFGEMQKWFGVLLVLGIPAISFCELPPIAYPRGFDNADLGFRILLNSPAVYPAAFKFSESDKFNETEFKRLYYSSFVYKQIKIEYEKAKKDPKYWRRGIEMDNSIYRFSRPGKLADVTDCSDDERCPHYEIEYPAAQDLIVGTRLSVVWDIDMDEDPGDLSISRVFYSTYIAETVKNPKTGEYDDGSPVKLEIQRIWEAIAGLSVSERSRGFNAKSEIPTDKGRSVIASDLHRLRATAYNYIFVESCDIDTVLLLELLKAFR